MSYLHCFPVLSKDVPAHHPGNVQIFTVYFERQLEPRACPPRVTAEHVPLAQNRFIRLRHTRPCAVYGESFQSVDRSERDARRWWRVPLLRAPIQVFQGIALTNSSRLDAPSAPVAKSALQFF